MEQTGIKPQVLAEIKELAQNCHLERVILDSIEREGRVIYERLCPQGIPYCHPAKIRYDKFCMSLQNLEDIYHYEEPYENVVRLRMKWTKAGDKS